MRPRDNLLMAIHSKRADVVVRHIMQVDLTEEIEDKKTPIQLAVALGHWNCVEAIANNKKTDAKDNARYGSALHSAVDQNRVDTARMLLETGAPTTWYSTSNGDRLLHIAVRNQNIPMLALLLSFDVDLTVENTAKKTPIQLAVALGHWNCVAAIATHKKTDADDNARYGSALHSAVDQNRVDTARMLLEAGAPTTWYSTSNGDRLLHIAVRNQNIPMIALLLLFNFDLNLLNNTGQTPSQLATSLNVTSLNRGWEMYYDTEHSKVAVILTLFVQAKRQSILGLSRIPNTFIESHLLPFLCPPNFLTKKDTINLKEDCLTKISANCLIKSFHGMFHKHSPESKKFITQLKQDVNDSSHTTKDIGKTVSTFLLDNNGKKTRTLSLLNKYKLTRVVQERKVADDWIEVSLPSSALAYS